MQGGLERTLFGVGMACISSHLLGCLGMGTEADDMVYICNTLTHIQGRTVIYKDTYTYIHIYGSYAIS